MKKIISFALAMALPFALIATADAQTKTTKKAPSKMMKSSKMTKSSKMKASTKMKAAKSKMPMKKKM